MHFDDGIKLAVIKTKVVALRSMLSSYYEELSDKKTKRVEESATIIKITMIL